MAVIDEIFKGLPEVKVNFFDTLYNDSGEEKKYNRTITFDVSPEMHEALESLRQSASLPFGTNRSVMLRHFAAAGVESLKTYLSSGQQSMWSMLQDRQRSLTMENYATTIDTQTEDAVTNLLFWTGQKEWQAVANDMERVRAHILTLPDRAWRTYAAKGWATNQNMRGLRTTWAEQMREEAQREWQRVHDVMQWLEQAARL